ncbi:S8 family serine peptidase [Maridesulfovibrio sp. FT414]|uniref:S8 family serine peptidase n=1 Tax=Maridesulfovibrio sp. FT414 TaxID=2979469 RepID=UPI003D806126
MINEISGLPEVESFSPNYIRKKRAVPDDPQFGNQWSLQNTSAGINMPAAWDISTGSSNVVIAVIDSGLDLRHEDMKDSLWVNPYDTFNGIDDDGNGVVDDVYGISINSGVSSNSTEDRDTEDGHGTVVSSVIAATGNNGIGVSGISWNSRIMVLRPDNNSDSEIIIAINYIIDKKQKGINIPVVNMSIGGSSGNPIVRDKIQELADNGIIFVTSAGNDSYDNDSSAIREYPASYDIPNIISVGASDRNGDKASFSHFGQYTVDLFAPGVDITAASRGGGYSTDANDGTSFAAPHVAGTIALAAAAFPNDDIYTRIRKILSSTYVSGKFENKCLTEGKLNATAALGDDLELIPFITGSDSREGKREGQAFTLNGAGFGTTEGSVHFCNAQGRAKASINTWSDSKITGVVPQDAGVFVQVTDSNGLKSNALQFTAWAEKQSPTQLHTIGTSVVRNGIIYTFGGGYTAGSTACEKYDPATNSWTTFTTMPAARSGAGTVFYNNEMYFFGGKNVTSNSIYSDIIKYSFNTNSWSTLPGTVPYPFECSAEVLDGKLYVSGGNATSGTETTDNIYLYNPDAGSFTVFGDMDCPRLMHSSFSHNGLIYIFGGINETSQGVSNVLIFNATDSSLSLGPNISNAGVTTDGTYLFLTGGAMTSSIGATPFLFTFDPSAKTWDYGNNTIQQPDVGRIGSLVEYIEGRGLYSVAGITGEGEEKKLMFLTIPSRIKAPASQPDSTVTINVTQSETSQESAGELKVKYKLPDSGDRMTDVREFTATVSKPGAIIHLQYEFTAPSGADIPADMTLYKLKNSDESYLSYSYAAAKNEWIDGSWWLEDQDGNYVAESQPLTESNVYSVHFCLTDNGRYDQSSTSGVITDPLVLFSGTSGSASGSSGCVMSPDSKPGLEFILGVVAFIWIIICAVLRRRIGFTDR